MICNDEGAWLVLKFMYMYKGELILVMSVHIKIQLSNAWLGLASCDVLWCWGGSPIL